VKWECGRRKKEKVKGERIKVKGQRIKVKGKRQKVDGYSLLVIRIERALATLP
jgi:hypothetical protein